MQSVSSGEESVDLSVEGEDVDYSFDNGDNNLEHKSSESSSMMMMNSPTDVRSYRDRVRDRDITMEEEEEQYYEEDNFNNSLSMLGDPLPIVREGSVLDDDAEGYAGAESNGYHNRSQRGGGDSDDDDDDGDGEVTEEFLEYQREQEEFRREMNRTKIAFASYRGAVLHLVHNQESFTRKSSNLTNSSANENSDESEDNQDDYSEYGSMNQNQDDNDTINTQDEANERMTRLEETAREIVETKAKACFEAVEVVKQFEVMREEKRQRRRMLLGGLAGVGGQDNVLAELRKMKRKKAEGGSSTSTNSTGSSSSSGSGSSASKTTDVDTKDEVKVTRKANNSVKKPEPQKKKNPPKANNNSLERTENKPSPTGPIVRLKKKPTRHPDCIKVTLPKFTFQREEDEQDGGQDNNGSFTPARYRTTKWIKNMVKWRIEKRKHDEAALTKCGCSDCLAELKCMYDNDEKNSLMKQ